MKFPVYFYSTALLEYDQRVNLIIRVLNNSNNYNAIMYYPCKKSITELLIYYHKVHTDINDLTNYYELVKVTQIKPNIQFKIIQKSQYTNEINKYKNLLNLL